MKSIKSILFFFVSQTLFSVVNDSINVNSSYEEIQELFYQYEDADSIKAEMYANLYLEKAKKEKNQYNTAKGFIFKSYIYTNEKGIRYADSAIVLTQNNTDPYFPTAGYLSKGYILYYLQDFEQSLDNFLIAYNYAKEKNNISNLFVINQTIATIKSRWGSYQEALNIYKKQYKLITDQKDYKQNYEKQYLIVLYDIGLTYIRLKKNDSADIFIKKGLKESYLFKNTEYINKFHFIEGTNSHEKLEYKKSIDLLNKTIPFFDKNIHFKTIGYVFLGKSYLALEEENKGIESLLIADSLFEKSDYSALKNMDDAYRLLIEYYKENKDYTKQLEYLEKLIYVDSVNNSYYVNINNKIKNEYELPELIKEKEGVIKKIEQEKGDFKTYIFYLVGIVFLLIILSAQNYYKQKKYKQRFKELLIENNKLLGSRNNTEISNEKENLNISEDLIEDILVKLDGFEMNKEFLNKETNLQELSKMFNTNSNYLSKIINHYKGKTFTNYINDLRVEEVVNRLKIEKQFRNYTIQAIAYESGFKSAQSFSKAFNKKTGIYPSYFIKEMNKLNS